MAGAVIWEAMACTETAEGRATPGITEIGGDVIWELVDLGADGLFKTQRFDWIQPGCFPGRIKAKDNAYACRNY